MISSVLRRLLGGIVDFWHPPERVCVDSRTIRPRELFFALPGKTVGRVSTRQRQRLRDCNLAIYALAVVYTFEAP